MQLVKFNSSSHWYSMDKDGVVRPQHDATLREARKHGLFISPTSIEKDVVANPMLQRWVKNEIAKAFVLNPRLPGETDEAYAERCLLIADQISLKAREKGTAIHAVVENHPMEPGDAEFMDYFRFFDQWFTENDCETIASEIKLADPDIGVAGTCDKVIMFHGELTIIDIKTQNVKKKPTFYPQFPRQLSFYAKAYAKAKGCPLPRIMSVIVDSNKPAPMAPKLYTREEQDAAYREFLTILWLWNKSNDYWPGKWGKWDIGVPAGAI